jgi:hypothetical protein
MRAAYGPDAVLPDGDDPQVLAAIRGVGFALRHLPSGVEVSRTTVVIEKIDQLLVDLHEGAISYAACFATWEALGIVGTVAPTVRGGRVIFPDG